MLPDLALTATVAGEPMEFVARDVPTGVFFLGFEDTFPGAECFARLSAREQYDNRLGFEAWADGLLCRAMVEPRLTPELVQRLGDARDDLAVAYLWGVGYHVPSRRERERLVPPAFLPVPLARPWLSLEDRDALVVVPSPNLKLALRKLATAARTAVHVAWERWSISEFMWTWRVAVQDDLKKRAGRASALPQSDLVDQIGREAS